MEAKTIEVGNLYKTYAFQHVRPLEMVFSRKMNILKRFGFFLQNQLCLSLKRAEQHSFSLK